MKWCRRLADLRGFRRCTRLDVQETWCNPPISAEQICDLVQKRRLWCYGYQRQRQWKEKNYQGKDIEGATQYFGSKKAARMVRIYNKAAEQGWDVPALRVEIQHREEYAEQYFQELLCRILKVGPSSEDLGTVEQHLVKDLIARGVDLRDIERWEGQDLPKNWARTAAVPDWWEAMLNHQPTAIPISFKSGGKLEMAWENAVHQYGRQLALLWLSSALNGVENDLTGMLRFGFECLNRLRREDLDELVALCPDVEKAKVLRLFHNRVAAAARLEEHDGLVEVRVAPLGNTGAQVTQGSPEGVPRGGRDRSEAGTSQAD